MRIIELFYCFKSSKIKSTAIAATSKTTAATAT